MTTKNKKLLIIISFGVLASILIYNYRAKNKKFNGKISDDGEVNLEFSETQEPILDEKIDLMSSKFDVSKLPENLKPPIRIKGEINPLARPKHFSSLNGITFMPRFDV